MDYNAWQLAITPCQIGRVHRMMSTLNSRPRKLLIPTWCKLQANKSIHIQDSVVWRGARDIEGHLRVDDGAVLVVNCRLSLPKNAKIVIAPTGKLILNHAHLHNACDDQWEGIEIQERGKEKGILQLIGDVKLEDMRNEIVQDESDQS